MAEVGAVLTAGELRALLEQVRRTANELEARLEGRPDDEVLRPTPVRIVDPSPIPPERISCWPRNS